MLEIQQHWTTWKSVFCCDHKFVLCRLSAAGSEIILPAAETECFPWQIDTILKF
jgi:hypothetical protein